MAKVIIPSPLRKFTGNAGVIEAEGNTVGEALNNLTAQHPELRKNILEENGRLRSFVRVYVDEDDIAALQKEDTTVTQKTTISIIPAIAGGAI